MTPIQISNNYYHGAGQFLSALKALFAVPEYGRFEDPKLFLACHCCELIFKGMLSSRGLLSKDLENSHDLRKLLLELQKRGFGIEGHLSSFVEQHADDHAVHGTRYSPLFHGADVELHQEINWLGIHARKGIENAEDWKRHYGDEKQIKEIYPAMWAIQKKYGSISSLKAKSELYKNYGLRVSGPVAKMDIDALEAQLNLFYDVLVQAEAA